MGDNQWETAIATGITEARRHLGVVQSSPRNTDRLVRAYASGLATGVMRWCLRKYGPRITYDLFVGLADEALDSGNDLQKGD